jgi:hypothetical protein
MTLNITALPLGTTESGGEIGCVGRSRNGRTGHGRISHATCRTTTSRRM